MKDGYYLAVYSDVNKVACCYHSSVRNEHNMTLFLKKKDMIEVLHVWEFERISRVKQHGIAFFDIDKAYQFIDKMLSEYNITRKDLQGIIGTKELDSMKEEVYSSISVYPEIPYHSICHIYSSLLNSDKYYEETILALAMDGGPDLGIDSNSYAKNFYCGALIVKGKVKMFSISSPGTLWLIASNYFMMREGTLMALASATDVISYESFELINSISNMKDIKIAQEQIYKIIDRVMKYSVLDFGEKCSPFNKEFSELENKISIIMKIIQDASIKMVERQIDDILYRYNLNAQSIHLALSGGYTLNCPTNTYVMHKYKFKSLMMCPCTNDSGISLGCGLFYFYRNIPKLHINMARYDLGTFSDLSVKDVINRFAKYIYSIKYSYEDFPEDLEKTIVWFQGRSEIGPRALGQRSILASVSNETNKDKLNEYKKREWWRPVAPIILDEKINDYFDNAFYSPYMLNNFVCKNECILELSTVLHLDRTARVQTLKRENNPLLYDAIYRNYLKTGIPVIANTSLNDKGEPIIDSIERAMEFALEKRIPFVYYNGIRFELKESTEGYVRKRELLPNVWAPRCRKKEVNPYLLKADVIRKYIRFPGLRKYDLNVEKDVKKLIKINKLIEDNYFDDLL